MSAKTNLFIDVAIFTAFLVAFEPALTGIPIHEWLSVALAAALVVHLLLHWEWVVKITLQFFRKLFHASRLNYVVDIVLWVAFVLVMLSGLLISRSVLAVVGIRVAESPVWRFLHSWSADVLVLAVGLHFALHWKWIVATLKRFVCLPVAGRFLRPRPGASPLQPASAPAGSDEVQA